MELSYAAYNPVTNEAIPGIPSNFMEPPFDDPTLTAEAELLGLGFEATAYNYPDENGSHFAAHTIGHKTTAIMNLTEETDNEYMVINSMVNVSDMDMDTGTHRTHTTSEHDSGNLVLNSSSSSQETENNIVAQQLVVISVRGSVTPWDWVMNLCTQFHNKAFEFEDGCEEVLESLYGYADCTECDGTDNTGPCKGYFFKRIPQS